LAFLTPAIPHHAVHRRALLQPGTARIIPTRARKTYVVGSQRLLLTAVIFLIFLQRLVRDAPRKVFLIVDNLRVHRAKLVTAWVEANRDRIELFYLPPYAPEFNPDEFMHNDLKQAIARGRIPKDKAEMKSGLHSYMRGLQRQRSKVRAFFQAPSVRYAA
jgi:hypothetical protein